MLVWHGFEGVQVRVIRYDNGINAHKGVDLTGGGRTKKYEASAME